ncbi:MAG: chloride channel protein [Anaerovoracaceae bacterium]
MKKLDRNSKNIFEKGLFRTAIRLRHAFRHLHFFIKWIVFAMITGVICGLAGTAFHYALSIASDCFSEAGFLLFLLPAAGIIIVFSYHYLQIYKDEGTNSILRAARAEDTSAFRVGPLIFLATFLTHLCGGSAGREGAALQIGGSIGSFFSRRLKLSSYDHQLMVMCGMSAAFSALFATPLAAAFLSIEIAGVGTVFYAGLVPAVLASFIAMLVSRNLGVQPLVFLTAPAQTADPFLLLKILVFASLIGLLSIIFCSVMHNTRAFFQKAFPNPYIRVVAGGLVVVILTLLLGTDAYNGAGMGMISKALSGNAPQEAFILKLVFTAVTLGCGFKGGEIVPAFFVGAAFGCTAGAVLGIDPVFAAELGLIGLFCGVVNCPVTSIFLSVELFGSSNFLMFGMTAAVSYLLSGYYSLYSGQKFMNSKLMPVVFERSAK